MMYLNDAIPADRMDDAKKARTVAREGIILQTQYRERSDVDSSQLELIIETEAPDVPKPARIVICDRAKIEHLIDKADVRFAYQLRGRQVMICTSPQVYGICIGLSLSNDESADY